MASTQADARQNPPAGPAVRRNGAGTAALVIGTVSVVLALLVIFSPLAFPLGVIAIILGAMGIARASQGRADNRGQAIAGLVMGAVSILVAITIGIGFIGFFTEHQGDLRRFGTCMSSSDNDGQRGACVRKLGRELDE